MALARPDKRPESYSPTPAPYHPEPYHPAPYHPEPAYHHPASEYHPEVPAKYDFAYNVADDYSKANFQHSENRDGYKTEGSYSVDLPDGRRQIVTYADHGEGLIAEVTYEGEAQYPEYKPAYKPAPYHPEPAPYHLEPAPYHPKPVPSYITPSQH